MLLYYTNYLCPGALAFVLLAVFYAGTVYRANASLADDNPEKRNYPPIRVVLAPVLIPLSILASISLYIIKVILYGVFLSLFVVGLVVSTALEPIHKVLNTQRVRKPVIAYQEAG